MSITYPPRYPPSAKIEGRWRRFHLGASGAVGVLGLASLVAMHLGAAAPALNSSQWDWLRPYAAAALVLAAAMVAWAPSRRRVARVLAAATLAIGGLGLAHRMAATPGPWWGQLAPGLVLVLVLVLAVLLPQRMRFGAVLLVLAPLLSGLVAILAQFLGTPWSPLGPHTQYIDPAAAACLLVLSCAWCAGEPILRPISLFHEPGTTGWLLRRVAPVALVFPLLLSWARGEHTRTHPTETWVAAVGFITVCFVIFLTLVWKAAGVLDRLDINRDDLRRYAHEISDLYDHAPCGYHSLDAEGRIVKINDTELSWLGYRRQDLVGRVPFADLLSPASRGEFLRHFAKVQECAAVQDLEIELRRSDGSPLPAVVSASAITDHQGRFLRTRSTLYDVTQRKQAEAALRRSEARNRAILASAADAIVTLEEGGVIVDFNPAAEIMFGMRRMAAMGMMGADLMAPQSPLRQAALADVALSSEAAPTQALEFSARRADGSTFPAELTLTRVAGQTPGLYTAFVRDLTERKRAEQELRTSEERLRLLLNSTGEGIYALDLAGNCILCNPAALRLLGYDSDEELRGRPIHGLIHHTRADGRPYPAHECRSFLAARQGIGIEVDDELFFRKDGSGFPVEYRSYPVGRNGQPVGAVVTFTDITTRRSLEGQIRQSQKMEAVGRLAAGIAHDFNNLLTVINGYSDLLLETSRDEDSIAKLRSVRAAGDRAATLTHQLLAFSRQQVLQPRTLDLNAVVRGLEPLLRRSIGEDCELTCDLGVDLPTVKADPSQLDQILMNLAVNARDAMPHGGQLYIATAQATVDAGFARSHPGLTPGPYALLSVRDTGTGMPADIQAHIFEPFFTTKPQGKGTGLGLPTVFGIARQSGGTVLVDSGRGQGTTMTVYLPVFAGATAAPAAPRVRVPNLNAPRPEGGGETILVVEDEDGLRRLLLEVLGSRGYQLLDAGRPELALEMSERYAKPIQLLISDVVMPSMSGPVLAERLLQQRPGMRVLYISGYSEPASAPKPCLKKPFTPEDLAQTVRRLLDQPDYAQPARTGRSN